MSPRDIIEWLRAGREILVAECGPREVPVRVLICYGDSGRGVEFILPPEDVAGRISARFATAEQTAERRYLIHPDPSLPILGTVPGPVPPELTPAPAAPTTGIRLRLIHRKILAAATDRPEAPKAIARRAGYPTYHSGVRAAFTLLLRERLLVRLPDGVCRPTAAAR